MYQKILVPTDGSDCATNAAAEAVSVAAQFDAEVHALYAVDVRISRPNAEVETYREEMRAEGEGAIGEMEQLAGREGVEYVSDIRVGDPRDVVTEYADDADIDLIVMGTHGRRGIERMVLGSITEGVVRMSDVPVLTVPRS